MKLRHLLLVIALLASTGLAMVVAAVITVGQFVLNALAAGLTDAADTVNLLIAMFYPVLLMLSFALHWHMLLTVALPRLIVHILDGHIWPWEF